MLKLRRVRRFGPVAFLVTVAALAGCTSGQPTLSADDVAFVGLDGPTVVEVLASPVAKDRVDGDDAATMKARYQNTVRNFFACRSALAVYQGWMRTGKAPAFPDQPVPAHPAMWAEDEDRDVANFRKLATSGEIAGLRSELLDPSGCGSWIPAKPGDTSGPTVGDVVRGMK